VIGVGDHDPAVVDRGEPSSAVDDLGSSVALWTVTDAGDAAMGIVAASPATHGCQREVGPAMTAIKVSPEQLSQLSSTIAHGSGEIDGILGSLRAQVAPLVGGDWAGQASAQFHAMFEQWQRSARDLAAALHGIGTVLANAGASYAQAEQQIAATFRH